MEMCPSVGRMEHIVGIRKVIVNESNLIAYNYFDKIDLSYCGEFTVGEIKECCVRKKCSDKKEQICAQTATLDSSGKKCRWFGNRCELQNHNCGNKTEIFKETDKSFCNFEYGNTEQQCMDSNAKKNETLLGS
ncbi:uncharacterized protein LOC129944764 [Eupeodes corollae]|uniref:uncharacterized protein LOC129944764 n=1 Tax=Eupeodes corollae TaxID=290404 RepID=UPI0024936B56|nr:uncharacterized protein LOC129944764 [Eupeodes corollae]